MSAPEPSTCHADEAAKTTSPKTRVRYKHSISQGYSVYTESLYLLTKAYLLCIHRIMTEYKDDIKQQLQNALEWILKNRERRQTLKLEAR